RDSLHLHAFPTRRSSDLNVPRNAAAAYRTFVTQRTPSAVTTPAAARGTRVWRSNSTRISHSTPMPPTDHPMLVSSDGTLPARSKDRKSTRLNSSHDQISY